MPSWWSHWDSSLGEADATTVVRRFVEASRRAEIIALVNSARTAGEVAGATVDELCEALEAEVAFLVTTRPERGERRTLGATGLPAAQVEAVSADRLVRAALGAARAEAYAGSDLLGVGARHLVLSPWTAEDGRQVVIGVARLYDEHFDPAELALLEGVTVSVGHALERCWLGAERDRHAARQSALARAAKSLSASLIVRDVLQTLSSEVSQALEADLVAVYACDASGEMTAVAGSDLPAEVLGTRCATAGDTLCARAMRDGEPLAAQPFEDGAVLEPTAGRVLRSGVAAPIRSRDTLAGMVVVGYENDRWVTHADVELVAAFAELAGVAHRNAADHAAAKRAASQDSLTGCLNHGAFHDRLREEIARAGRNGRRLGLVLLDLDEFKAVNDTLGHLKGDELLRGVADALRDSVRAYDQVGRYGGDEFALLLPDADEETARQIVSRALAAVGSVRVGESVRASASAGLALWRPPEVANALIERADRSLFASKRRRRAASRGAGEGAGRGGGRSGSATSSSSSRSSRQRRAEGRHSRWAVRLDERAIAEAALLELTDVLGLERCLLVRRMPHDAVAVVGAASDRSMEEPTGTREVPDVALRALALQEPVSTRVLSEAVELAVPVVAGAQQWGAIAVRAIDRLEPGAVDLVQAVADHLGAVLCSARTAATLSEALDEATGAASSRPAGG